MFLFNKYKRAFQNGSRLIRQKKWEEALQILEPLQGSSAIDPIDLSAAINQAREGYFQQQIGSIETSIARKQYFVAIQQLNLLDERYPGNERISRLLSDAEEEYYEQKIAEAQTFLRQNKFDEAESLLVAVGENLQHRELTEQFLAEVRLKKEEKRLKTKRRRRLINRVMFGLVVAYVAMVVISNRAGENIRNQQATATAQARVAYFARATQVTWTPTVTRTSTNTPTPTLTSTATYTATVTPSPTVTGTSTSTNTPSPTRTPTSTPVQAAVKGNGINARSCPSQNCQVLDVLDSNETFEIVGEYDGWYGVILGSGTTAYISSALVAVDESASIPVGPTLTYTPTASNTPSLTSTSRPTRTPTPEFFLSENDLILVMEAALISVDIEVESLVRSGNTLTLTVFAVHSSLSGEEYLATVIRQFADLAVFGYREYGEASSKPSRLRIRFVNGNILVAAVSMSYNDARRFIDGEITAVRFLQLITYE